MTMDRSEKIVTELYRQLSLDLVLIRSCDVACSLMLMETLGTECFPKAPYKEAGLKRESGCSFIRWVTCLGVEQSFQQLVTSEMNLGKWVRSSTDRTSSQSFCVPGSSQEGPYP
jgi:hypothetical protein